MQTPREALIAAYTGIQPDFMPNPLKYNIGVVFPGDRYFGSETTGIDAWGVNWTNLGPDPGLDGSTPTPGHKVLTDISDWKNQVHFPDLEKMPVKDILQGMLKHNLAAANLDRSEVVTHCLILSGTWERANELMGMEDALCAFYEDPDSLKDLFQAITEYKIKCISIAIESINPDIIHMHDDWGTSNALFFSPQMWREFLKPCEKRIADHIHSLGKIYEHHSCGYITPIIPDIIEIGIDAINPLNVCNNLAWIKKEYGSKITMIGGIDNQRIDTPDAKECDIRAEIRRAMDLYATGGRYISSFVCTHRHVWDIYADEAERYGKNFYHMID
ncbi:uroporphyrinogen decarboxylase family protein [Anaerobium acetethylicum]|uniref:Uroporphyrinogen decarboxylase n=1 Tax=Anaerobium acetethylicum TaxID=1619234 RepID=A0A1D3TY22_9FIRM|nr:uroporphyrinogen decarboxylase family protein [Anaerobium acetethylicum]SCP99304.1 uroporphyrinogen decarboxylase [Anaerobium acetethylicum]